MQSILSWRRAVLAVGVLVVAVGIAFFLSQPIRRQGTAEVPIGQPLHPVQARQGIPQRIQGPNFDLSNATVPKAEIRSGGPPKDGIPALSHPRWLAANEADYMRDKDRVIGVVIEDQSRAYPLKILNYHEIINDKLGQQPLAVTYCPLCDSAVVFDRRTPLGEREFGVSGLLYNSNVLMYDRAAPVESQSLWSQVKVTGVSGPGADKRLTTLPLELTTWADWKARHPASQVLSDQTGHRRDYQQSPYASYISGPQPMFPAQNTRGPMPTKTPILGVWVGDVAKAFSKAAFSPQQTRITDTLDGKQFTVQYSPQHDSLRVVDAEAGVEWMYSLWFAWYAFHPDTTIAE